MRGSDKNLRHCSERGGGKKRWKREREGGRTCGELGPGPAPRRRSGWVEVLLVLGRGLDKHNTSVVGPSATIGPDVHFSVGPAQFVNTCWHELHAGWWPDGVLSVQRS